MQEQQEQVFSTEIQPIVIRSCVVSAAIAIIRKRLTIRRIPPDQIS